MSYCPLLAHCCPVVILLLSNFWPTNITRIIMTYHHLLILHPIILHNYLNHLMLSIIMACLFHTSLLVLPRLSHCYSTFDEASANLSQRSHDIFRIIEIDDTNDDSPLKTYIVIFSLGFGTSNYWRIPHSSASLRNALHALQRRQLHRWARSSGSKCWYPLSHVGTRSMG